MPSTLYKRFDLTQANMSVPSLSKIAFIYRVIATGVVGNQARTIKVSALKLSAFAAVQDFAFPQVAYESSAPFRAVAERVRYAAISGPYLKR